MRLRHVAHLSQISKRTHGRRIHCLWMLFQYQLQKLLLQLLHLLKRGAT